MAESVFGSNQFERLGHDRKISAIEGADNLSERLVPDSPAGEQIENREMIAD
jgi:hypothetical protein